MVFKDFCVLVLGANVASALEGLRESANTHAAVSSGEQLEMRQEMSCVFLWQLLLVKIGG